jgi:hypothetical protein
MALTMFLSSVFVWTSLGDVTHMEFVHFVLNSPKLPKQAGMNFFVSYSARKFCGVIPPNVSQTNFNKVNEP